MLQTATQRNIEAIAGMFTYTDYIEREDFTLSKTEGRREVFRRLRSLSRATDDVAPEALADLKRNTSDVHMAALMAAAQDSRSVLHAVVRMGSLEELEELASGALGPSGADQNPVPLAVAAANPDVRVLHFLLEHGTPAGEIGKDDGQNALMVAVEHERQCWEQ